MTNLDQLLETLNANRMGKKHEDYGFPRGWNEAFDFIEREIRKMKANSPCPHGFDKPGYCSECNFD